MTLEIVGFQISREQPHTIWLKTKDGIQGYPATTLLDGAIAISIDQEADCVYGEYYGDIPADDFNPIYSADAKRLTEEQAQPWLKMFEEKAFDTDSAIVYNKVLEGYQEIELTPEWMFWHTESGMLVGAGSEEGEPEYFKDQFFKLFEMTGKPTIQWLGECFEKGCPITLNADRPLVAYCRFPYEAEGMNYKYDPTYWHLTNSAFECFESDEWYERIDKYDHEYGSALQWLEQLSGELPDHPVIKVAIAQTIAIINEWLTKEDAIAP